MSVWLRNETECGLKPLSRNITAKEHYDPISSLSFGASRNASRTCRASHCAEGDGDAEGAAAIRGGVVPAQIGRTRLSQPLRGVLAAFTVVVPVSLPMVNKTGTGFATAIRLPDVPAAPN